MKILTNCQGYSWFDVVLDLQAEFEQTRIRVLENKQREMEGQLQQ